MGALRTSELVSVAYFLLIAVMASTRPVPRAVRLRTGGLALAVAVSVVLAAGAAGGDASVAGAAIRDWLPLPLLLVSYWLPSALVTAPRLAFERSLLAIDRRLLGSAAGRAVTRAPRPVREVLELGYLAVYPMVPLAFALLLGGGFRSSADRFWSTVLTAEYLCYILLPLLPTRPPREIDRDSAYGGRGSAVRCLNLRILDRASNRWNTFPSGHVAGAAACALAVLPLLPGAGAALRALTALIAVGSIAGRYHYAADAASGLVVAGVAFLLFAL